MERTTYLQEDQGNRNYQNSSILNLKTFCNVDVENNARAVIVVSCYSIKKKKKWKMEVSLTSIRECCILFFVSSWPIIIFRIFLWKMATAISRIEKRQLKGKKKVQLLPPVHTEAECNIYLNVYWRWHRWLAWQARSPLSNITNLAF